MRREIERAQDEIEGAIEDGMTNEFSGVLTRAERVGRTKITDKERVWRGRLLDAFRSGKLSESGDGMLFHVANMLDYAEAQNDGFKPDSPPPVEALLPWVRDHMYAFEQSDPRRVARALAVHIHEEGVEGIFFAEAMRTYLETKAESDLQSLLDRRL